ncbi:hypothetical protein RF11_03376 [Thelohanellus kitauei]|uniref:Uncharacterized protein n=1 Tax=Thelohanellus kitauei TaxID=669202 RepID=A0A0C2N5L4_THEKT|nr:hypothetical protein RF11_03376 [Thelohanellus kitauei]
MLSNSSGTGHFIRAFSGEYRINLVTLDGLKCTDFEFDQSSQNMNHGRVKKSVGCNYKNQDTDTIEKLAFTTFQTGSDSVYVIIASNDESSTISTEYVGWL